MWSGHDLNNWHSKLNPNNNNTMPTFTYNDPKQNFEFKEFTADPAFVITCTLPSKTSRSYSSIQARLYVTKDDYDLIQRARHGRPDNKILEQPRVGILAEDTTHPLPAGIYIPFKLANWGTSYHLMDGLYGDFIYNEKIRKPASKEVKNEEEAVPAN